MDNKKDLSVLVISHMFPSRMIPKQGVFLCREMNYLRKFNINCQYIVPFPITPWPLSSFKRWEKYSTKNYLDPLYGFTAEKVSYLRIPGMWFRRYEGKAMAYAAKKKAIQLNEKHNFDAVMGVPMMPDANAAVIVGKKLGLPTAGMAIGSDVMVYPELLSKLKNNLSFTIEKLNLVIGVSQAICRKVAEFGVCRTEPLCVYLGRGNEKARLTYDKLVLRKKLGFSDKDVIGIYVGNLIPEKGIPELAQAYEHLSEKYSNLKLVCVGSGRSRQLLSKLNAKAGAEIVHLTGQIPPHLVPQYLKLSDFMVFPSHSEGMPQAVLEAMDCGLPVIATKVGGIPEAIIDGQTGILIAAGDVEALESAIKKMSFDKKFRIKASEKSLQRANIVFNPLYNAKKLAEALFGLKG